MWDVRDNNKIIHILKYIPMRLVTRIIMMAEIVVSSRKALFAADKAEWYLEIFR